MKFWPFKNNATKPDRPVESEVDAGEALTSSASTDSSEPAPLDSTEAANYQSHSQQSTESASVAPDQSVLADDGVRLDQPVKAVASVAEKATSSGRWKRALSRLKPQGAERPEALPIRVILGYLPEVSARDAKEYAQGMAEKHFEQMGLSYFEAFEFGNGQVFEAHEGGHGKAYAPEIIQYFESLGPYQVGELNSVTIRTASRYVEVQRMREGLAAILLPEATEADPTPWLRATTPMIPGLNRRTAFLYGSVAVFATGVLAMLLTATVFRLQPYSEAPAQKVESISAAELPRSQWPRLEALPPNSYVKSLRYRNDRWESPEIGIGEAPSFAMSATGTAPVTMPEGPANVATPSPSPATTR